MTRTYLVECYWPGVREAEVAHTIGRASATLEHLGSLLVLEDEIVLSVFAGPSAEAVRVATRCAGLPAERVVETVRVGAGSQIDERRPS